MREAILLTSLILAAGGYYELSEVSTPATPSANKARLWLSSSTGELNVLKDTGSSVSLDGTVPVSRGGTGLTALGTARQMLRVNAGATALAYSDLLGSVWSGLSSAMTADLFCMPMGFNCSGSSSSVTRTPIPYTGTIKKLYCHANTAQGVGDTCVCTVREGACTSGTPTATALTCTVSGATQACSNTSSTATVTAGNCLEMFLDEQAGTCDAGAWVWSFELMGT